ncbi:MAG: Hsp70 family protein [Desulfobulbaceae bacterium]|nr:Hsp70 family protein [Desulfobulbaceae bacterium]
MKNFIGIDLGTTNSAICSYDGSETRTWKSPEQNDVTPSVIYIDRRGNKYVGKRAYDSAPHSPDNAAMLFKRLMGTSTPVQLSAMNLTKTPEECSAEVLKVLFGYLPEEIRNDPDTGTVITVPAAFNQMQKDATMQAASMAGLGKIALMQEPVAAVMSVMRARNTDGMFLIYDLGGGTLDIAIAESIGGRVNLLAHGGIAMCGGRDFDRVLVDNVVRPWLLENFDLPEDFSVNPSFKSLIRLSAWATERAKIELSAREDSVISLSETEARVRDLSGNEIYLDIPLQRATYDKLISERVGESIESARETLNKAGLSPHDLERIVFVGGPTNYKPLRDKVAFELGIPGSTDVNPMTAVAEGASLFAESIDWSSQNRSRKNTRGQISSGGGLALSFNYIARTPDVKAKIAVQLAGQAAVGSEFQIDSVDTGWTSGRLPLKHGATIDVTLTKTGDNTFKVFMFDSVGGPIALEQDKIVITRTAATVDAIPASHSVGIEVLEKLGGRPVLDYLIRSGDSLPKKGKKIFKAAESLKAGASGSLNLKLWEGEIEDPITDNRPIGVLKISGSDFDDGVIHAGADLECEYEILDSGNIIIEVSVPCIGGTFHSGKNFYSRQEGQLDYTAAAVMVVEEGERTLNRIDEINEVVDNPKLEQARQKLESAVSLDPEEKETEKSQEAMEKVLEARRLLAQVRKEHLKEIRQIDLDGVVTFFDEHIRQHARPSESSAFDNLAKTAQRCIGETNQNFEHYLDELKGKNWEILWRQDWFVVDRFKWMASSPHLFADKHRFQELTKLGAQFMRTDDIEKLRAVVGELYSIKIGRGSENDLMDVANIIRG